MESHIAKYESVLSEYRTYVIDRMSPYDYNDSLLHHALKKFFEAELSPCSDERFLKRSVVYRLGIDATPAG